MGVRTVIAILLLCAPLAGARSEADRGRAIYAQHCASCHGDKGEGVADEYDEPLWGNRSLQSLTRYIHRTMPEDEEEKVIDADAAAVASFIYDAFYSPAAQARNRPPRVQLTRLTNDQYRQSVADLVGSFGHTTVIPPERGLKGRYFSSEKMNKEKELGFERVDSLIDFDFGNAGPGDGIKKEGFSIRWSGALLASHTGHYDFRIRTQNGATLKLNSFDTNRRKVFIDAYVSSGNKVREETGRMFLLAGRAYPLELQYFSYQEETASIRLDWKPPHGVWEPIPTDYLMPHPAAPVTVVSTPFSADDRSEGYERGTAISQEWQEATTTAAITVANHIITNSQRAIRINEEQRRNAERMQRFCREFAERAFRRPLTTEELEFFVASRFAKNNAELATKQSLILVLTSPRFLYPGLAEPEGTPDDWTLASRLALALWDSLPDEPLRRAAREGKLQDPAKLAQETWRMMQDPRCKAKTRAFFHHWLALDERDDLNKDPKLYPGFDERIAADLRVSLDRFIDEVVWSPQSDYRHLLTADYLFLNPRLAEFYGIEPSGQSGFTRTAMPQGRRAGVFTHPYLLSAFAYHNNTSPIHRGVFLSRNVLGRLLKPPPQAIAFKDEDFDPNLTMREKVTQLTKKETCMQCHAVINPIGFSLEGFDAVGRFRTKEGERPVNTVSDYINDHDKKVTITGPHDLAKLAIESPASHRAFITHLFHHLVKQPIDAYGVDTLDSLRDGFTQSDYSIQKLIVEIIRISAYHQQSSTQS